MVPYLLCTLPALAREFFVSELERKESRHWIKAAEGSSSVYQSLCIFLTFAFSNSS